jgi:hypothetical protein
VERVSGVYAVKKKEEVLRKSQDIVLEGFSRVLKMKNI